MINIKNKPPWLEIDGDALRQYIDAESVFTAWEAANKAAAEVQGGMYWKCQKSSEYLIRTSPKNAQKSLGPRSEENEAIYKSFIERKTRIEARLADLSTVLIRHQRMNKALRVGRAPRIIVDIHNMLSRAGISEYFTVVGDHALYAYETAAGVRLGEVEDNAALTFVAQVKSYDSSFLGLLKKVDATFEVQIAQRFTAVNSKGFEVKIVQAEGKDGALYSGDYFSSMIVSSSGHMARMNTISPRAFARFKRWKAGQPDRDLLRRIRDIHLAELVEELVRECLPHLLGYELEELVAHIAPENKHDFAETDFGKPVGKEIL